ncbi:amidohydrolase family protein [Actinacidiphila yeochonensis]|uniref:amidohydrolase family protein n=1 Tax=Actinacidiphila yeochonensis TaxID=89050 RepID=UPI0005631B2B|nr:amidohydrolase family protein [Actinacidiphila yeochonensis]
MTTNAGRIDVHQHLIPAAYRALLDQRGLTAGGWPTPDWDPQSAIGMMDRRSIATGVLSISSPGVHLGDDAEGRALARSVNEFGAELVKDRPDRFGLFASVPLPDVDGAVAEAVYALDELHADGVVLLSNAHGRYLGEKEFEPLWAELDARSAVVFIHPTAPQLPMLDGLPSPLLDFPFDTTRTALHMVANGVMSRHTQLKVILSHGGGFLPYAAVRFAGASQFVPGTTSEGILADLRRFYFDTALSATPYSLPSLLAFAEPGHVLYGSDSPFASEPWGVEFDAGLDGYSGWQPGQQHAVNRGSAEALFPRLARP